MKIFKYKHRRTRGQGEMPNINVVVIVVAETPGWPQTCYVAGVDLELHPVSISRVLGLGLCVTRPSFGSAGDWTQVFVQAGQVLYPLRDIFSLTDDGL